MGHRERDEQATAAEVDEEVRGLALQLARRQVESLADLDVVKPYFRSREARRLLEPAGIDPDGDSVVDPLCAVQHRGTDRGGLQLRDQGLLQALAVEQDAKLLDILGQIFVDLLAQAVIDEQVEDEKGDPETDRETGTVPEGQAGRQGFRYRFHPDS